MRRLIQITFLSAALAAAMLLSVGEPAPERALAVPANDNLAAAKDIQIQPYTDWTDTTGAGVEVGETTSYGGCQGDWATPTTGATVWYRYTHTGASATLQLDTLGGQTDAVIAVNSAAVASPGFGDLTFIACGDADGSLGPLYADAGLTFSATTGTTYYIQLGGFSSAAGMQMLNLSHVVSTGGLLFTVNSTADTGDPDATPEGVCDDGSFNCTLREAIQEANFVAGTDNIRFSIGSGSQTIGPGSALPAITSPVVIDARTQPGFAGTPIVELAGNLAGSASGIDTGSGYGDNVIRGLVVNQFSVHGIALWGPNNVVQGNYLGTNVAGTADLGNGTGLFVTSVGNNNTIGGTTSAARNLISGNNSEGIWMRPGASGSAKNNRVMGNYIGTDVTGMNALGNGTGVLIQGTDSGADASANQIGGHISWPYPAYEEARNIISGNNSPSGAGVRIDGAGAFSNYLGYNYIGLSVNGLADVGNTGVGVDIRGASSNAISNGNHIAGNDGTAGVRICGAGATCGTFMPTTAASSNLVGSVGTGPGMFQPGNTGHGILIDSASGNSVFGSVWNNGGAGVRITGAAATGNSILCNCQGNGGLGIDLGTSGVTPNDGGAANDADTGPNDLLNFPVVTSATITGGSLVVKVSLDTVPSTSLTVALYISSSCDPSGYGEGSPVSSYFMPATTDGNGEASVTGTFLSPPAVVGTVVTATTFNPGLVAGASTSEFSACRTVQADVDADTFGDGSDNCPTVANAGQENSDGDALGDACDGCPTTTTAWSTPMGDADCDAFPSSAYDSGTNRAPESITGPDGMGTDPLDACADTTVLNDESPDPWPMDNNDDRTANLSDILAYIPVFNTNAPRFDLNNDNLAALGDVLMFIPFFNITCTP